MNGGKRMNDKILNIYGQEFWHTDAKIVGNKLALIALRNLIDSALKNGKTSIGGITPLFASDGEGYELTIICTPTSDWEDHTWKDNAPEYTGVKRDIQ